MNTGDSPYSTKFNDKPINRHLDTSDQQAKYKEEEKTQKADPILPHELEHLTDKLGDTFISLTEVRRMLDNVKNNASVEDEDIKSMQDKIDQINNLILDLPEELAKLSL
tara:strand:- start:1825 stop:2151 length:327 start_codon:yes stop_codon:yes gene_type:complete